MPDGGERLRVLSGMRPTGSLHLGHLCGVLNNWLVLQENAECFFFIADWHALTTDYAAPGDLTAAAREMVITWLAAGIDGERTTLFIQSHVPEHAELHVLLSMLCPLQKLMQMPTYREMKENLARDLDTYGFLGYPLLQSADILAYRATGVPVGEDQRPHVEFTREIARRVNRFYGGGAEFEKSVKAALGRMPTDARQRLCDGKKRYQQTGQEEDMEAALAVIDACPAADRRLLRGYCLYEADEILPMPESLVTEAARLPGTDGRKMSKSYGNTIELFAPPEITEKKVARMKTDPARVRRQDKGNPEVCPVWDLHKYFSDDDTRQWVRQGCESGSIGCLDCKKHLSSAVNEALSPMRRRRVEIEKSGEAEAVLADGICRAREVAGETLVVVRRAMGLAA